MVEESGTFCYNGKNKKLARSYSQNIARFFVKSIRQCYEDSEGGVALLATGSSAFFYFHGVLVESWGGVLSSTGIEEVKRKATQKTKEKKKRTRSVKYGKFKIKYGVSY